MKNKMNHKIFSLNYISMMNVKLLKTTKHRFKMKNETQAMNGKITKHKLHQKLRQNGTF